MLILSVFWDLSKIDWTLLYTNNSKSYNNLDSLIFLKYCFFKIKVSSHIKPFFFFLNWTGVKFFSLNHSLFWIILLMCFVLVFLCFPVNRFSLVNIKNEFPIFLFSSDFIVEKCTQVWFKITIVSKGLKKHIIIDLHIIKKSLVTDSWSVFCAIK